jgi:hypothetical protein
LGSSTKNWRSIINQDFKEMMGIGKDASAFSIKLLPEIQKSYHESNNLANQVVVFGLPGCSSSDNFFVFLGRQFLVLDGRVYISNFHSVCVSQKSDSRSIEIIWFDL